METRLQLVVAVIVVLLCTVLSTFVKQSQVEPFKNADRCPKNGLKLNDVDIYLINMEKNSERLERFIEQYMLSDLRYKQFMRFNAVDGSKIDIKPYVSSHAKEELSEINKKGYRTKHYQLTNGAVGCYLSHLNVMKKIAHGDSPYGLVFEDDVMIDNNIFSRLIKSLEKIPNDWDILLLGCQCILCDKYEKYYDTERFFLMHAYIIKKESAKAVYDFLDKKKIDQQIDSELSDMVQQNKLRVYCLKDTIARQSGFRTTIQMPLKLMSGVNPFQTVA